MLFNRFLLVRFVDAHKVIGGRTEYVSGALSTQPTIEIEVSHTNDSTPNEATVRIYNVAPAAQRELFVAGHHVEIEAGYWPQDGERDTGIIFKGQIREVNTSSRDLTDTVSELKLGDGDDGARVRRAFTGYPAGTSHGQIVADLVALLAQDGIERGTLLVPDYVEARPLTIDRPVYRELDDIAHQHNLLWSVQDGVVNMYPADRPLRENTLSLSPETGVINAPEFTHEGVEVTTLMLHFLRPGDAFVLRNQNVSARATERFRIDEITFSGDNQGGDFGARITAKIIGASGEVKRSRDRGVNRRR